MGLSRGAYAGDIGIGYNAIIHAQSSETNAKKQASLAIVGIFFNTFILCTISSLIVLLTGTWHENIDVTLIMQKSLSIYFPYMEYFMPLLLFLLSFLTLITYYFVGLRCAEYIAPKKGKYHYSAYAFIALPLFAVVETTQAFVIMSLCGAFLLLINLTGMFILRKEIEFKLK